MMMEPNYNIVVIGMGNIGKFLMPGYRLLLGDKVETNVFGVRNNRTKFQSCKSRSRSKSRQVMRLNSFGKKSLTL